jgi:hypothetical protein
VKDLFRHCRGLFLTAALIFILAFLCIGLLLIVYVIVPPEIASGSYETVTALVGPLFVMAIVWLVSVYILIGKLELDHYETYHTLGEPRIGFDYTQQQLKAISALLGFILRRKHQSLNDKGLSRVCDFMAILFIMYVVGFGVITAAVVLTILYPTSQ